MTAGKPYCDTERVRRVVQNESGETLPATPTGTRSRSTTPRRTGGGWIWGGFLILALIGLGVWAWLAQSDDSAGPELGVTVEDVTEDAAFDDDGFAPTLVGQQVTVSGNVSEVLSENAFRIGGNDFGGDGLLVIGATNPNVEEGQEVRITGTVREFDAAAFERDFGFAGDSLYDPWENANVLVAASVSRLSGE